VPQREIDGSWVTVEGIVAAKVFFLKGPERRGRLKRGRKFGRGSAWTNLSVYRKEIGDQCGLLDDR